MDIKEVVKTAILRNSHEWGDEQAEAVLKAINEAGFLVVPAKAQAVPEGYVLMPIKPTETMVMAVVKEHEGDAFLPYSLYDAYVKQAMIEAQEQTNDK
ncbi:hypothetical protein [Acinetobacter baumannii]|uniref:hypothetical protein n=1 Tax=Acinetobacter baumannii TaxID=470 RepID=UPI001CDBEC99|nr:hypothetical protein [Acinetobacter baumannii]MCA4232746.1 hypothetical protein [Acinetobacter baumannii]